MREIHHILCPVDLSDLSPHAIDHAVLLARWYNATITELHVYSPIVIPSTDFAVIGFGPSPVLSDDQIKEVRQQVAGYFARAGAAHVNVCVESGRPATQILERSQSLPADLIVIGTHGHGGFQHLVLGSVTEKVLRQATCPVMTIPPLARTTSKLPFKRLLCPIDFSEPSLAALELAFSLAREADAELTILHVVEWLGENELIGATAWEIRQELELEATVRLEQLIPDGFSGRCRPTTRITHGKAYREILDVAAGQSSDLIVMGVHGRNALDLMLFGSTTNQVVRRATCPVLTLRH